MELIPRHKDTLIVFIFGPLLSPAKYIDEREREKHKTCNCCIKQQQRIEWVNQTKVTPQIFYKGCPIFLSNLRRRTGKTISNVRPEYRIRAYRRDETCVAVHIDRNKINEA